MCHRFYFRLKHRNAASVTYDQLLTTYSALWHNCYEIIKISIVHAITYSQEVCYQYWPSSGNQQCGEYSVDLLGEEELEGRVLRTLNITHSKVELTDKTSKMAIHTNYLHSSKCEGIYHSNLDDECLFFLLVYRTDEIIQICIIQMKVNMLSSHVLYF